MAIPINIILYAGKIDDPPKSSTPPIPKNIRPLDVIDMDNCYVGQIIYDFEKQKCFKFTENGWKEIR